VPLPPSTLLGPYEIISLIGAGGMGEVYRARDKRLNRDVAIKVLGEGLARDQDRRARFEREARAVAALNHPNIVSLFDIGTQGDILYTVSELVGGESLRALLRRGPVTPRKVIDIAVQLADGMAAAHSAGITHRDLKPENVMVASDERVKILDFGLARQAGGEMAAVSPEQGTLTLLDTQPGTVMGTVNYMSPEQARGLPVNYHSDQFSFGLILYEMVSGTRAFQRETTVHTLAAIISEEPPPIEPKLPPPLRWAIDRCLAKEPSRRYESTRDLYHDLRDLRDHLSEAYTTVSVEPVKAAQERSPFWKWIAIPSCLLLAAAIALLARRDVGQDISRYRYTPFAMNPEGQSSPVWSPDGKSIAYAGTVNGHPQVFVRSLNSSDSTQLTSNREYARPARWSPDSKRILFFAPGPESTEAEAKPTRAFYSIAVVGGEPELLAPVPDYAVSNDSGRAEISPDNQTAAIFGRQEGGKATVFISSPLGSQYRSYEPAPFAGKKFDINATSLRFAANGQKLLLIRTGDSGTEEAWLLPYPPGKSTPHRVLRHFPAERLTSDFSWMSDNRHVVMAFSETSSDNVHLWIADTESEESYQITGGVGAQSTVAISPDGRQIVYSEQKRDLDITTVSLIDGKSKKLIATDVFERMAAWSAKADKLGYVTDRNGPMEIWMRSGDGSDHPLVTQKDFPGSPTRFFMNPVLSPDGKRAIFTRGSEEGTNRSWIMSLSGGAPERLNDWANYSEYAGTWSPDGRRFVELVFPGSNASLAIIKVGSRDKPVILRDDVYESLPDWSPTGEWLTFQDKSGWNLISADGKTVKALGEIATGYLAFSKDGKLLYGIREEHDKTTLFSLDIGTLKVTDIHELGRDLAPTSDFFPSIRFSLTPDGKSITYTTGVNKSNLWILEGFRQPGLLSRLGLNWSR